MPTNLKKLLAKVESNKSVEARRHVGSFWVVQDKSLVVNDQLRFLKRQFVVFPNKNIVTVTQKNRQRNSVQFLRGPTMLGNMASARQIGKEKINEYKCRAVMIELI